jgi:hypothetical protein
MRALRSPSCAEGRGRETWMCFFSFRVHFGFKVRYTTVYLNDLIPGGGDERLEVAELRVGRLLRRVELGVGLLLLGPVLRSRRLHVAGQELNMKAKVRIEIRFFTSHARSLI